MTSEIFIDLCEFKEVIETKFYEYIIEFKNKLFENIQYPALFGKTTLNNSAAVSDYLNNIIEHLNEKIAEINAFLEPENT